MLIVELRLEASFPWYMYIHPLVGNSSLLFSGEYLFCLYLGIGSIWLSLLVMLLHWNDWNSRITIVQVLKIIILFSLF